MTPALDRSPDDVLFHIAEPTTWARAADSYVPASFETEGFIHLSAGHQVIATTERHYAGRTGLILLEISTGALDPDALRWEPAASGEDFPHLHDALPVAAVTAIHPWPS